MPNKQQRQQLLFPVFQPVAVAYGGGVDSTAMLVELVRRGERPDIILNAEMGNPDGIACEREETDAYVEFFGRWLQAKGFPPVIRVRYVPKDFKNWPPYYSLAENCLTNGTLSSIAFGFGSCSVKWKIAPQHKYLQAWAPAQECWARGGRVVKLIGYDAGPRDTVRGCNHEREEDDHLYEYRYPLQQWCWDRTRCIAEIRREGLPVPHKSSCVFCTAMQPEEIRALKPHHLRLIVVMEARAKPRLKSVGGLWRSTVKGLRGATPRPGLMTDFIRAENLLPAQEIDRLWNEVPKNLVRFQEAYARAETTESLSNFIQIEGIGRGQVTAS